jgi:hypothetical protein
MLVLLLLLQTPTMSNVPTQGFAIDILHPHFRGASGVSFLTSGIYLTGRMALNDARLRFELPFAYLDADVETSTSFGNPYVGVEWGKDSALSYAVGARFPLASDAESAVIVGTYADITRFSAFLPHVASFDGDIRYHVYNPNGFTFEVGGGPQIWFPTEGGGDAELFVTHHFSAGYRSQDVWLAAGFSGITILSEDAGGIGERTINELNAAVGMATGKTRVVLHLLLPLDEDVNADVGYVVGLGVGFGFRP